MPKIHLKRYWNKELWSHIYLNLLNPKSSDINLSDNEEEKTNNLIERINLKEMINKIDIFLNTKQVELEV